MSLKLKPTVKLKNVGCDYSHQMSYIEMKSNYMCIH